MSDAKAWVKWVKFTGTVTDGLFVIIHRVGNASMYIYIPQHVFKFGEYLGSSIVHATGNKSTKNRTSLLRSFDVENFLAVGDNLPEKGGHPIKRP